MESDLFGSLKDGEKGAVLVVHFGTTHEDTRAKTIDAVNKKIAEAFPGIEVREAWTSRIVMRRLKAQGIQKMNPEEALKQLKSRRLYPYPGPTQQYHRRDRDGIVA